MNMIRLIEIAPGQVLYRFYDSRRAPTPDMCANRPWWLEFEHFQTIKHFALQHGYDFGYAARIFAAILYDWSEVDSFVACRIMKPLSAWKGRGKQVQATGKDPRDLPKMTLTKRARDLSTLYPGIGGNDSLASRIMQVQSHGTL